MLHTDLKRLETSEETREALENNENVVICCGRMGPMCTPPFTVYFKSSKVVAATTSIQTRGQITEILDRVFSPHS